MSLSTPKSEDTLLTSMTKNAGASVITGALGYIISTLLGLPEDLKTVAVGASVLLGSLIYTTVKSRVTTFSKDLGKRYMEERTGIVEVFDNLEACEPDMKSEFKRAKHIRLLLQVGRKEFGDGESSYFGNLAKEKYQPDVRIRVLRASKESPFLSPERAKSRGTNIRRWHEDMRRLANEIDLLRDSHGVKIEDREHCEPFLWRIFIFDDVAYVSAYLHQSDNDLKAVIYKYVKGEKSLFSVFDKYFEYLWAKSDKIDGARSIDQWAMGI